MVSDSDSKGGKFRTLVEAVSDLFRRGLRDLLLTPMIRRRPPSCNSK